LWRAVNTITLSVCSFILGLISCFAGILDLGSGYVYHTDLFRSGLILVLAAQYFLTGTSFDIVEGMSRISTRANRSALVSVWIIWSALWGLVALMSYWGLHTGDFDVGIFGQSFHSFSRGDGPFQLVQSTPNSSFWEDHQSLTIMVFSLFYMTPIGTELLLFSQAFLLFLPGLLLALWVNSKWKTYPRVWSWLILILFLQSVPIQRNTFWEWHETALSFSLLVGWGWAFANRRPKFLFLLSLLAGLTKQYLFIVLVPGTVAYLVLNSYTGPSWVLGSLLANIGLFVLGQIIFSGVNYVTIAFGSYGNSLSELIENFFLNPSIWATRLLESARIDYFTDLLVASGYLSVFSPLALAWVPLFIFHAIADRPSQYSVYYHYSLEIWALMSVSTLYFWMLILRHFNHLKHSLTLVAVAFFLFPSSEGLLKRFRYYEPDAKFNRKVVRNIENDILEYSNDCQGQVAGFAGQWMFSSFFQLNRTYPIQSIGKMKMKKGFSELLNSEDDRNCIYAIIDFDEKDKLSTILGGKKFRIIKEYDVLSFGQVRNIQLLALE